MKTRLVSVSVWLPVTVIARVAEEEKTLFGATVIEKGQVISWKRAIEYADYADAQVAIEEAIHNGEEG